MSSSHPQYALPKPNKMDGPATGIAKLLKLAGNANGVDIVSDTTLRTGKWCKLEALNASAVLVSLAGTDITVATPVSVAMGAGAKIVGNITKFKLSGGAIAAYKQDATATT